MKFRWFIASFITVVFFIQFIDRVIISLATEAIMNEFGFSPGQFGIILSAFFWGLVPAGVFAGIAADRWGSKKVFAVGAAWWSIFTAATAGAFGLVSFVIARVLFGIGEGPALSNAIRIVTNWFSPKEYSTALGLANSGVYIAPALATPVIVWTIANFGWRFPFYVMGVVGLIWVLCWLKWFTDKPETNRYMTEEEKQWIKKEQGNISKSSDSGKKMSFKELLTIPREVRGTILANLWAIFCFGFVFYFLLTWLPGYLMLERGLNLQSMGVVASIPWLGAALGSLVGGRLSDYLYQKTNSRRISRAFLTAGWFTLLAVCLILVNQMTSIIGLVSVLTFACFVLSCGHAPITTVIAETVPERAGSIGGLTQLSQTLPGIFAPMITGFLVEITGSFQITFAFSAGMIISSIVVIIIFLHPPEISRRVKASTTA
ncbi:MFS transporter [Siminovitchia sediminis]|uniref:MFS transporter n=1 Tax=Siminovitchia sediminis TaxID=1274353 RepID=A0ABW4KGK8_9BACI